MAESFASTDEYVASRLETSRLRLPVRLLAVVFVMAAVAGLGRTVDRSAGVARRVRTAGAASALSAVPHGWEPVAVSSRSAPFASPTVRATTGPPVTAVSPVTGAARPAPPVAAGPAGYGCGAALAWLSAHAAPGFTFLCPGYAYGHQAMTCVDVAGVCPGQRIIAIADPCPVAYMNEAHNSWVLSGLATGRLDPYGWCA